MDTLWFNFIRWFKFSFLLFSSTPIDYHQLGQMAIAIIAYLKNLNRFKMNNSW